MPARLTTLLLLLATGLPGLAAEAPAETRAEGRPIGVVVAEYVAEALRANLALQSQSFEVERQMAFLDEARSRFYPQLDLLALYARNEGGREFEVPGGESFAFLREREQDTRLSLRQPVYAPAIPAALRAREAELGGTRYAREALARRLERDVTVGYLDWLRARGNVAIVDSSVDLLRENLRVNDSLYANGRVTQDQVLRARSELLEVQQQQREIVNSDLRARQFVNFLLNRPLDGALEAAVPDRLPGGASGESALLRAEALQNRPELREQDELRRAAEERVVVARAERRPELSLGLDAGIQGEDYDFGRGYDFATASLAFTWRLFDGGAIRSRVAAARATARQAATRREELAREIELEVQQALDRLQTAADSLATAEARAEAARAGFRIAGRKRDQGVINQVEFIDARSALTSAELNLNLTRFALLAREAELVYATAASPPPDTGAP